MDLPAARRGRNVVSSSRPSVARMLDSLASSSALVPDLVVFRRMERREHGSDTAGGLPGVDLEQTTLHHGEASNGARLAERSLRWLEEQEREGHHVDGEERREHRRRPGRTDLDGDQKGARQLDQGTEDEETNQQSDEGSREDVEDTEEETDKHRDD